MRESPLFISASHSRNFHEAAMRPRKSFVSLADKSRHLMNDAASEIQSFRMNLILFEGEI
jgi:hypothetical protein